MSVKETTLEIKLENLKENFKFLKSRVSSSTKFMAVVKHSLKDTNNGRIIHPDTKLTKLLKVQKNDELTFFNLQRYMKPHFAKAGDPTPA